jgi:hypothetical protein
MNIQTAPLEIALIDVTAVAPAKSLGIIPNALVVTTCAS